MFVPSGFYVALAAATALVGGNERARIPIEIAIAIDPPEVAPGQQVQLTGLVPVASATKVDSYDIWMNQIAVWDPESHRMVNLVNPEIGAGSFGKGAIGGPLQFDVSTDRGKGFVAKYVPEHLGVYLMWFEWRVDNNNRSIASPPVLLAVHPPRDSEKGVSVKPDWTQSNIEDLRQRQAFHRHQVGFTAAMDKSTSDVGDTVAVTSSRKMVCFDVARICWFDPSRSKFCNLDVPQAASPKSDLDIDEPVQVPAGGKFSNRIRPKRLGVYLITATCLDKDGRTRTTSQPMLLTVVPKRKPNGDLEIRPEWLAEPPMKGPLAVDPKCELDAGLPPRE